MKPFERISSPAVVCLHDNIDTDFIFPGEHLKVVTRSGLGQFAFQSVRFDDTGNLKPDSPFDRPPFNRAKILIAGANFGCGSSREHAVWCLSDIGIRAIIAESFADIFASNCVQNGVLTVALGRDEVELIARHAEHGETIAVDLETQTLGLPGGTSLSFDVDPASREILLKGLDPIALTLEHVAAITAFEERQKSQMPWLYADEDSS